MQFSVSISCRPSVRSIIATLCAALLACLLGGCSALRIGYGTAPELGYWWLDRYLDFRGEQPARTRAAIDQFFAWHRRTQLPDYVTVLARMRAEAASDTTPARVCAWQRELMQRLDAAVDHAAPLAGAIAVTLQPEQIVQMRKRQASVNDDFRDDYLQSDPDKRAAAALKRTVERVEVVYGTLSDAQRSRMAAALKQSPFDPEVWLAERQARQQDIVDVLQKVIRERATTTREQAAAALRGYVGRIERSPNEAYRRYTERLMEFNCAFVAELHNGASAEQRRHAIGVLAGWENDLRTIMASRTAPAPQPGE